MTTTTVKIEKPCDVKLDGAVQTLQAGELLNLPTDKAQRLIDAGFAKSHTHTIEECRQLVAYFGEQDPGGGCWEYIKLHHADLWASHMKAFRSGDLDQAQATFDEMVTAWGTRNKAVQPELLAA